MATLDLEPQATADDGMAVVDLDQIDNNETFYSGLLIGVNWLPDDEFAHVYFRFPNATIPQGATISVAYLELNANGAPAGAGDPMLTKVYGIDEDNHTAPTSFSDWNTDHGLHTTAAVDWDFNTATSGTLTSPSLVSIIQEIVDRGGWSSGNAIGIHWDDDGTSFTDDTFGQFVESLDNAGSTPPNLHIEYVSSTLEQEGFRWRNDDGDEDGATWRAAQDTDITAAANTPLRLRVLTDASGDPGSAAATLQYKRSDEPSSEWRTI